MTTFARLVAALLALAIGACAFLPWTGANTAFNVSIGTLLTPGKSIGSGSWVTSLALPIIICGGLVMVGAVGNSRALVIIGALGTVAVSTIWILVNAISRNPSAVPLTQIQIGAYGAAIAGFMALILAAVAVDTRVPSVR